MTLATVPVPEPHDADGRSARFDDVVEALGIGVFETSLGGRVIRCNEACAGLFGFANADALRQSTSDIGAQVYVDPGRRIQQIARLLVEGKLSGFIAQMRRRDGTLFWASETVRLVTDPRTGERHLLGSITDVSEVVDQREALAAAERDYRSIFDNATVGIYRTSIDGRQLRANRALWKLNGYASEAEMLADASDIERQWYVDPNRRAEFRALIERDDRVVNFESEIHRYKTRERIWIRENAWAVRDTAGELLFYEGIVEEITLERQAAELQRAQETADRQLQALLLRSAERLRVFADIAADWYWEADEAGVITFMSEGVRRIGLAPEDFIGRDRTRLAWDVDRADPGFRQIGDCVARRESYKNVAYPVRFMDGSMLVIASSGQPQFDSSGAFIGYLGVGRDVTDTHLAREGLARSEARFRDAIDSMSEGLAIWDADDRLVAENRRLNEILPNLANAPAVGEPFAEAFRSAARAAIPGGSETDIEQRLRVRLETRKNGVTGELYLPGDQIVEVTDRRTSEGGFITVYRDVTELRRTLQRLAESEARFRDFAETTADWFWEQDAELRFTYVSDSNFQISGLAPEEHYGKTRGETKPLGVPDADWAAHQLALMRREAFRDFRFERIDQTGRRRYLAISGKPLFTSDDVFAGYRGSGKDLTDLVETQRALETALEKATAAMAQQRKFAETMAHEFRTPLTIIDGASQRMLRYADTIEPDELRTRIGKIRSAVRGMGTIIDTMLSSARLAAGRLDLHPTSIDLVAFAEGQVRRFDPAITGREFILSSALPSLSVLADEKALEQIIANLLSNAIKYSGESRRVDLTIAQVDGSAVLAVRDYGIGIPAEEVPKLFTRFFRASTAKSLPGTGIGLNLVHELVAMHGGTITVASELGHGTTFTVTLPSRSANPGSVETSVA